MILRTIFGPLLVGHVRYTILSRYSMLETSRLKIRENSVQIFIGKTFLFEQLLGLENLWFDAGDELISITQLARIFLMSREREPNQLYNLKAKFL